MKLTINIPDEDYKFIKDLKSIVIGSRGSCKTLQYNVINAIKNAIPYDEISQDTWIPVKTRPLTEEEKELYPDYTFIYDCRMPEDGEEVLVTTKYGVCTDIYSRDDEGCYFECYCDDGEVLAWMRFPKPYKESDKE